MIVPLMDKKSTKSIVITIDGPAGVGKSTAARGLARRLGAVFLDTGAMYRAVTLAAVERGIDPADTDAVAALMGACVFEFRPDADGMRVFVDGAEKTAAIRDPEITGQVRHVAAAGTLRARLVALQQAFAARCDIVVTEGRDQGTVAFPDAPVKLFLTANPAERARRRHSELTAAGKDIALESILTQQQQRDASDESRTVGPLKPAADAILLDTTDLTAEQVVETMETIVRERLND
jgi:cytidylate kinase